MCIPRTSAIYALNTTLSLILPEYLSYRSLKICPCAIY